MLELYEQNRVPPSQVSEAEGNTTGGQNPRSTTRNPAAHEEQPPSNGPTQAAGSGPGPTSASRTGVSTQPSRPEPAPQNVQNHINDNESMEMDSVITDHNVDAETRATEQSRPLIYEENTSGPTKSNAGLDLSGMEKQERDGGRNNTAEGRVSRDDGPPRDTIKMIDKDKVKAALEKRRKSRGEVPRKKDLMDEDDLIERALEEVELAVEDEKTRQERRQWCSKAENSSAEVVQDREPEYVEEGEMLDGGKGALNNNHKRKRSPVVDRQTERKHRP